MKIENIPEFNALRWRLPLPPDDNRFISMMLPFMWNTLCTVAEEGQRK